MDGINTFIAPRDKHMMYVFVRLRVEKGSFFPLVFKTSERMEKVTKIAYKAVLRGLESGTGPHYIRKTVPADLGLK